MTPESVKNWIAALGGRRFLLVVGAGVVDSIFFAVALLSENGYITLTAMTVGAYITANVAQKVMNKAGPSE